MTSTRRHFSRLFLLLVAALTAAASARAAESYLKLIPSTALGWGAVNHMQEASDKIQKLATIVGAPAVSVLEEIKKESGAVKGLDEKGTAGIMALPGKVENDPWAVVFVAVADYKAFLGNFEVVEAGNPVTEIKPPKGGKPVFAAQRSGYALVAIDGGRPALEAVLQAKQNITGEVAGLEAWLAENDGSMVGTAAGIKLVAKLGAKGLKEAKENIPGGAETAMLHSIFDMYGKVLEGAAKELSLAVAGIRCDKQGAISVIGRARLVDGGLVSKAVAGILPAKENLLSGLPGGPFFLAGGGVSISAFLESYMNLTFDLLKGMKDIYGLPAEDLEAMKKDSLETVHSMHSMSVVMKTGKRGDPVYSNVFGILRVDNAQKLLDVQEKYMEKNNKRFQNAKGMFKGMAAKRLEIAGKPALQQEITLALPNPGGVPNAQAMFDQMIGAGGKMVFYYVALDEHTIVVGMNVSPERMAAALDVVKQPKKCLSADADVAVTIAMLPADSQWVLYISFRGYAKLVQRMMIAAMPPEAQEAFGMIPDFPQSPPMGFAVKATPAELRAEIAVPASLVKAGGEYFKQMQGMMMQRSAPPAP